MCEEIVNTGKYAAYYYGNNSNKKDVIVFCFAGIHGDIQKKGFGVDFFINRNFDVIFVSCKKGSYYQELSNDLLYKHVAEYIKDKQVFTYGVSLGGYAALYYAQALGAKAIAFSPRCSADPIYKNAHKLNVQYNHDFSFENCGAVTEKPIVIIDKQEEKDSIYLSRRILPAFPKGIDEVNLHFATHNIPKAMQELNILKEFITYIILNKKVPKFDFDFTNSVFCLSHYSMIKAREGFYEEANKGLERILYLQKSKGLKIKLNEWRLLAYKALIEHAALNHKVERSLITGTEKSGVIKAHVLRVKNNDSHEKFLISQFHMHIALMEYELALELAKFISVLYTDIIKQKNYINIAKANKKHAEKWVN